MGEDDWCHRHLLLTGQGLQHVVNLLRPNGGHQRCDGGPASGPLPQSDSAQNGVHTVAVGVVGPDLALRQVGHVLPEERVGHESAHGEPSPHAV